ncbi:hypothetical protein [Actinacidiphila acidipaludis]|uniref:Uncharacterized protein n=1 Tax=Actinacidiphila acidipaludis TaxID=2873382 RepID=A0ABS7QCG9_9ACTN|nr:hypothetical protein [Streptomyces acidipaludis]MBY8880854.1 hypothetical protein [Streptomyces acidipaludis]
MGRINDMLTRHQWLQFAIGWVLAAGIVLLVFPGRSPVATLLRVVLYSAVAIGMAVTRRRREKAAAGRRPPPGARRTTWSRSTT